MSLKSETIPDDLKDIKKTVLDILRGETILHDMDVIRLFRLKEFQNSISSVFDELEKGYNISKKRPAKSKFSIAKGLNSLDSSNFLTI